MRNIDFLSLSPNNFIFQKESNKTTFGGGLSIIYLIIAFFIFVYFRAIYWFSEPYELTSFVSEQKFIKKENRTAFINSQKYNPILPMGFSLVDENGNNLSDKFILVEDLNNTPIQRDKVIFRRVDNIHIDVLYKCNNSEINKTGCEIEQKDEMLFYSLQMHYLGFSFEPQKENPIEQNVRYSVDHPFSSYIKLRKRIRWIITRYEDNKGLYQLFDIFGDKEEENIKEKGIFIGGKFEEFDSMIISKYSSYKPMEKDTKLLLIFDSININAINHVLYNDYKRKEKSLLDVYANIFSLWITIYNLFTFLFSKLYSKSFDKYKIIEKILSYQKENLNEIKNKFRKEYKVKSDFINEDILLENDSEKEYKERNLIYNINDDISDRKDLIKKEDKERILPKQSFIDFIYNTFYCGCCCYQERQKMINSCNDIILKYNSIENILYNEIMIENLLKDYKWNNPDLKNILNNNYFNFIKNNLLKNNY